MATKKKLLQAAAGNAGGAGLNVEEVFSTYLYTGDNNAGELNQHIKNNISLGSLGSGGSSVNFSGNQYLTRSDFSGNSDGKELTFSAWILFNDFENNFVFSSDPNGGGSGVNVGYFSGKLRFTAYNSGGSVVSQWHVDDSNTPFHQWFHLCFSVNTASGVGATKVYINDVAATKESVASSNQNIDRTKTVQRIGVRATDYKLTGNMAHVFMDYTYRNLDTESNRRLFIDANGGSTDPSTLSALNPIMYCPLTDDYTMGKNLGTGGDFTSSGGPSFSSLGTEATGDASGGLVWIKNRDQTDNHMLFDTDRGASKSLSSNDTGAEVTNNPDTLTQFLADGFFLGDDVAVNTNNEDYASWTFRKAPKFFDIVTWTGDGTNNRKIPHNLGSVPGCYFVKQVNDGRSWSAYHRGVNGGTNPEQYAMNPADTDAQNNADYWNDTAPTSTEFTINNYIPINESGGTFVAYLWAHNDGDGEFGPTGDQDIIKCGSFVPSQTWQSVIDIGFEPQWIMYKKATGAGEWNIVDSMRGVVSGAADPLLVANSSAAEVGYVDSFSLHANGFEQTFSSVDTNTYIYIAIRRPTAVPESATDVFDVETSTSATPRTWNSGFPVDLSVYCHRDTYTSNKFVGTRLTGNSAYLVTNATSKESSSSNLVEFDHSDKIVENNLGGTSSKVNYMWKRAPHFCDVVAYTGDGTTSRYVNHNLEVIPELVMIKRRSSTGAWWVDHDGAGAGKVVYLYRTNAAFSYTAFGTHTSTQIQLETVAHNDTNNSGSTYIAYLFATLAGISKVGSVTHSGTTNVDCGFTSGARFVLLKRTDATGDWYVWDSERGIVSGNDPYLLLNTTGAEVTNTDYIDPLSSGFTITSSFTAGDYIFYAIA